MIQAIIIDDEFNCIKTLAHDLADYCPQVTIVEQCSSAKNGLKAIRQLQPDLVFLDINMPWMSGLELLEVVGEINFDVIFTTAHDQYAVQAFRMGYGAWSLGLGAWSLELGVWSLELGAWGMVVTSVYKLPCAVYSLYLTLVDLIVKR